MFDKYIVGQDGHIVSKYNGKILAVHIDRKGYHRVNIHTDCGKKTFLLHRVIALVHIPNQENSPQINHLDGDKSNNCVDNLEWSTGKANVEHSVLTGLVKRGKDRPNSKLTDDMVIELRRLRKVEGLTYYELADKFGIAYQTAHKVCSLQTYTHLGTCNDYPERE